MRRFYSPFLINVKYRKHNSFFSLLEAIREDPYQYLTSYSIKSLAAFLDGYEAIIKEYNIIVDDHEENIEFIKWIGIRYGEEDTYAWDANILFHSKDEVEAFDTFYNLLDEFKAERFKFLKF